MINLDEERIFDNKTSQFLLPCLRGYGDEFVNRFNTFYKYAVGVSDFYWYGATKKKGRFIFVLCNSGKNVYQLHNFSHWIKNAPFFIGSYCPEPDIQNSNKLMIVLEVPRMFHKAYDMFILGKYSKMFSREDRETLFKDKSLETYQILSRNIDYMPKFLNKLNTEFNSTLNLRDFREVPPEIEMPLRSLDEIFNTPDDYYIKTEEDIWKTKGEI